MAPVLHDMTLAWRALARDKTFALAAILTLGLCIGANAAMFAIVNAVLLEPLPFEQSDRLVAVHNSYPKAGVVEATNGVPDYYDRKEAVKAFEALALYQETGRTIGTDAGAERVLAMAVTTEFFELLRVRPQRGRLFTEADGVFGQHQSVVLSYAMWQQQFGGRDEALGTTMRINAVPHTVVGILPPEFVFVAPEVRLWLPLAFRPEDRADDRRHSNSYAMIARLRTGATIEQARSEIDALNARNLERFPALKEPLLTAGFHTRSSRSRRGWCVTSVGCCRCSGAASRSSS